MFCASKSPSPLHVKPSENSIIFAYVTRTGISTTKHNPLTHCTILSRYQYPGTVDGKIAGKFCCYSLGKIFIERSSEENLPENRERKKCQKDNTITWHGWWSQCCCRTFSRAFSSTKSEGKSRSFLIFFSERRLKGRAFRITFLSSIQWEISRYFDLQQTKQFFPSETDHLDFFAPLLLALFTSNLSFFFEIL